MSRTTPSFLRTLSWHCTYLTTRKLHHYLYQFIIFLSLNQQLLLCNFNFLADLQKRQFGHSGTYALRQNKRQTGKQTESHGQIDSSPVLKMDFYSFPCFLQKNSHLSPQIRFRTLRCNAVALLFCATQFELLTASLNEHKCTEAGGRYSLQFEATSHVL
jgi:hypothetical protein